MLFRRVVSTPCFVGAFAVGVGASVGCGNDVTNGTAGVSGTAGVETGSESGVADVTGGPTTAASMSATGATTTQPPDETTDTPADSSGGPIFDVGSGESGNVDPGDCCGPAEFSYIWIANSSEGTVSKINTRTLVEEGRYLTRDTPGNPSRTSVSVDGRAVAVANRSGGVIKIWARPDDCAGNNTSNGPGDVKPWGTDDCVAWYTPFPAATSQRPVAWTTGSLDEATCDWKNQKVWTAEATCPGNVVRVHRLDGNTGVVEESIELAYPCTTFGFYGGAVDSNNDFWLTRLFESSPGAIRVDYDTLLHDEAPSFYGYGITVDHEGKVWGGTGIPGKWDPAASTWTPIAGSINNYGVGLAEDLTGRMWVGIVGGIQAIDVETMVLGETVMFPGEAAQCKGISVDLDGYIWAVPDSQDRAYKVDPDDYSYEMIGGLVGAYTYSDMTGGAINSVACNPPAG